MNWMSTFSSWLFFSFYVYYFVQIKLEVDLKSENGAGNFFCKRVFLSYRTAVTNAMSPCTTVKCL